MPKIDKYNSYVLSQYRPKDVAKAMEYLDTEGYFSYDECFDDGYEEGTLRSIKITGAKIEDEYFFYNDDTPYPYFIPKNEVVFEEPEEKKYRPYMYLDELPFNVGDVVYYRCKQCCSECRGIVTEIEYQSNNDGDLDNLFIGGINCTPQELFDNYELKNDDCEFVPFGVEE